MNDNETTQELYRILILRKLIKALNTETIRGRSFAKFLLNIVSLIRRTSIGRIYSVSVFLT